MKAEKCKFHSKFIEYLRYILFSFELTMFLNKINMIQNWFKPKKIKNMQTFLEFAYYQFIYNYLNIIVSLTWLI